MNKDDILAKARKENKGADIAEVAVQSRARSFAGLGMLIIGAVLNWYCQMKFRRSFPEFWVMFFGYFAVHGIVHFILGRKKTHTALNIVYLLYGLLMTAMTVEAVRVMFRNLMNGTA